MVNHRTAGGFQKYGPEHPRFKTTLCKEYEIDSQLCTFGENCCFAHGTHELRQRLGPAELQRSSELGAIRAASPTGDGGAGPPSPKLKWRNGMGPDSVLYKTELCRDVLSFGRCNYGENCCFAHGEKELQTVKRWRNGVSPGDPRYKSELCREMMATSHCAYGETCCFAHGADELLQEVVVVTPACSSAVVVDVDGRTLVAALSVTAKTSQAEQKQLKRALKLSRQQAQDDSDRPRAAGPEGGGGRSSGWERETELIRSAQLEREAGQQKAAAEQIASQGGAAEPLASGRTAEQELERQEERRAHKKMDKLIKSLVRSDQPSARNISTRFRPPATELPTVDAPLPNPQLLSV